MNETGQTAFPLKGEIKRFVVGELLVRIFEGKLSGRLHTQSASDLAWIEFRDGFPVEAQIVNTEVSLGMILRELGFIDDGVFNDYLMSIAKKGQNNIQVLSEMGLSEDQLKRGLTIQLLRRLSELFAQPKGEYWFTEDKTDSQHVIEVKIHPFSVVYNGIKNTYKDQEIESFINDRIADQSVRVSDEFQRIQNEMGLPADEIADIELLRECRLLEDYLRASKSGASTAKLLLFMLDQCRMLEIGDRKLAKVISKEEDQNVQEPGSASNQEAKDASSRTNEVLEQLRMKLKQKIEQIKANDHLGVLEVTPDDDLETIKKSYVRLTKVYHPDRVAAFNDKDVQNVCSFVFGRISEAYAVLTNPKTRNNYFRTKNIKTSGKVDADPEEATLEYEKARVYINKKNYTQAVEHLHAATKLDPDNANYRVHCIWFDCISEGNPGKEKLVQAKKELLKMYQDVPSNFYVNRYLCLVFKMLGDDDGYIRHLKKANWIKPDDIETARELRLMSLREGKKTKGSGLSFFKKRKQ